MKLQLIYFLRKIFPFLLVVALWRLTNTFWNPAGILALIPIFFCTFVWPVKYFVLFSILFCFLIDYNANTLCYWTVIYCIMYSANGFQNVFFLNRMDKNALPVFMVCFGISLLFLALVNFNFYILLRTMWIYLWGSFLYLPITTLIKKVNSDR